MDCLHLLQKKYAEFITPHLLFRIISLFHSHGTALRTAQTRLYIIICATKQRIICATIQQNTYESVSGHCLDVRVCTRVFALPPPHKILRMCTFRALDSESD